jgi:CheY-like chemotaxis protein
MKKTVLVVEDNPANLTLLRDVLSYHGYEVIEAGNGREGIDMAFKRMPDVILMDIQMPVMNGYAAIAILKKDPRTRAIKIIAVTSFAMAGDRQRILESGADGYISKPIDIKELPKVLANYIGP